MEKDTRFLDRGDVEIERDGTRYAGTYSVADGIVTVYYRAGSRKAHAGRTAPEVLAEFLLDELVADQQES
jgi:hypothetical protein